MEGIGKKLARNWEKQSDGDVLRVKDHHRGRGSEATGGRGRQKVTHAAEKRSDGDV